MSVSFRRTTQNSFPSRVGQDSPGLSAGLPDAGPARPERQKAVDLLIAVRGAAGEVKMYAVLDRPGIGDRHEAHAGGRVLAGPDDDLVLPPGQDLPAGRLRPEPGRAGQIVSVNDDVVEPDGHAGSMRGTLGCIRKPAVLPRTGRSPEVTSRDSTQIV
jgi:hypothetical protein